MARIIDKITKNVWKFHGSSNIYYLHLEEENYHIVIDTGNRSDKNLIKQFLDKVINLDKVNIVIFTHLHYDHIGNFDLFKNAKFYASSEAIEDFNKSPENTVLNRDIAEKFKQIKLNPVEELNLKSLEIIKTPGHTRGSICIWYPQEKIIFTGDTIFNNNIIGRTDLPTSLPKKIHESLIKLVNYNYKHLCPGHDY